MTAATRPTADERAALADLRERIERLEARPVGQLVAALERVDPTVFAKGR